VFRLTNTSSMRWTLCGISFLSVILINNSSLGLMLKKSSMIYSIKKLTLHSRVILWVCFFLIADLQSSIFKLFRWSIGICCSYADCDRENTSNQSSQALHFWTASYGQFQVCNGTWQVCLVSSLHSINKKRTFEWRL
jgi:hypothetical protein